MADEQIYRFGTSELDGSALGSIFRANSSDRATAERETAAYNLFIQRAEFFQERRILLIYFGPSAVAASITRFAALMCAVFRAMIFSQT